MGGGGGGDRLCSGYHTRLPPLRSVVQTPDPYVGKLVVCLPMPDSLQCRILTNSHVMVSSALKTYVLKVILNPNKYIDIIGILTE